MPTVMRTPTKGSAAKQRTPSKVVGKPYLVLPCLPFSGSPSSPQPERNFLAATIRSSMSGMRTTAADPSTSPTSVSSGKLKKSIAKTPAPKEVDTSTAMPPLEDVLEEAAATALSLDESQAVYEHLLSDHKERKRKELLVKRSVYMKEARYLRRKAAARRIEDWWKLTFPVFAAARRRRLHNPTLEAQTAAAARIQYAWLFSKNRKARVIKVDIPDWIRDKLLKILANFRLRNSELAHRVAEAATKIQAAWRAARIRRITRKLRLLLRYETHKNRAAIQVQRMWKGFAARRVYAFLRVQNLATTRIQAIYRGYVWRRRYIELKKLIALPPGDAVSALIKKSEELHAKWVEMYQQIARYKQEMHRYHLRIERSQEAVDRINAQLKKFEQRRSDEERAMTIIRDISDCKQTLHDLATALWNAVRLAEAQYITHLKPTNEWFKIGMRNVVGRLNLRVKVDIIAVLAQLFTVLKSKITSKTPLPIIRHELQQRLRLFLSRRIMKLSESETQLAATKVTEKQLHEAHAVAVDRVRHKNTDFTAKYRSLADIEERLDVYLRVAWAIDAEEARIFFSTRPPPKTPKPLPPPPQIEDPTQKAAVMVVSYSAKDKLHRQWQSCVEPFLSTLTIIRSKRAVLTQEIEAEFPRQARQLLGALSTQGPLDVKLGILPNIMPDLHARVHGAAEEDADLQEAREKILDKMLSSQPTTIAKEDAAAISRKEKKLTRLLEAAYVGNLLPQHMRTHKAARANADTMHDLDNWDSLYVNADKSVAEVAAPRASPKSPRLHLPPIRDVRSPKSPRISTAHLSLTTNMKTINDTVAVPLGPTGPEEFMEDDWNFLSESANTSSKKFTFGKLIEADATLLQTPRALRSVAREYRSRGPDSMDERVNSRFIASGSARFGEMIDPPLSLAAEKEDLDSMNHAAAAPFVGPAEKMLQKDEQLANLGSIRSYPADLFEYTVEDVSWWVAKIGLGRYQHLFEEARIDGTVLSRIRESDVVSALGIADRAHSARVIQERNLLLEESRLKTLERIAATGSSRLEPLSTGKLRTVATVEASRVFTAAKDGRLQFVASALNGGFDVNTEDSNGDTLLIVAVKHGHKRIIDLVVARDCDVNHTNRENMTALLYCTSPATKDEVDPNGSIARYLVLHGARDLVD